MTHFTIAPWGKNNERCIRYHTKYSLLLVKAEFTRKRKMKMKKKHQTTREIQAQTERILDVVYVDDTTTGCSRRRRRQSDKKRTSNKPVAKTYDSYIPETATKFDCGASPDTDASDKSDDDCEKNPTTMKLQTSPRVLRQDTQVLALTGDDNAHEILSPDREVRDKDSNQSSPKDCNLICRSSVLSEPSPNPPPFTTDQIQIHRMVRPGAVKVTGVDHPSRGRRRLDRSRCRSGMIGCDDLENPLSSLLDNLDEAADDLTTISSTTNTCDMNSASTDDGNHLTTNSTTTTTARALSDDGSCCGH
jgi:hypothetical protein